MVKTKEINFSHSKKETIKDSGGNFLSKEFHYGKTIELDETDIEIYETQKLIKEVKKKVEKEFGNK